MTTKPTDEWEEQVRKDAQREIENDPYDSTVHNKVFTNGYLARARHDREEIASLNHCYKDLHEYAGQEQRNPIPSQANRRS